MNRIGFGFVLLFLAVFTILLPISAKAFQAGGAYFRIEDKLHFEYFSSYDFKIPGIETEDLSYIFNSLRLGMRKDNLRINAQIDSRIFADHLYSVPEMAPQMRQKVTKNDYFNIERISVETFGSNYKIVLGDFYLNLLRGIGTSFRKEDDYNYDRSLRGALIKFDNRTLYLTSFAGLTNILNIDPSKYMYKEDPYDLFAGGETKLRLPNTKLWFTADAIYTQYGLLLTPYEHQFLSNVDSTIAGGSFFGNNLFGSFDFYTAAAGQWRAEKEMNYMPNGMIEPVAKDHSGYALYGSFLFRYFPVVVLLEGKAYKDFRLVHNKDPLALNYMDYSGQFPIPKPMETPKKLIYTEDIWYNWAPTLLPKDVELQNNQDARGLRLKVSVRLWQSGPLVSLDGIYIKTAGVEGSPGADLKHTERHIYAGLEWPFAGHRISAEGGWWDDRITDAGDTRTALRIARLHVAGSFRIPIIKSSTDIDIKWRRKQKGEESKPVHEFDSALTVSIPWNIRIAGLFSFEKEEESDEIRYYPAGSISWQFRNYLELSVMGGKLRGGYRCFGGTCRQYPDFEGVKFDITARF